MRREHIPPGITPQEYAVDESDSSRCEHAKLGWPLMLSLCREEDASGNQRHDQRSGQSLPEQRPRDAKRQTGQGPEEDVRRATSHRHVQGAQHSPDDGKGKGFWPGPFG